MAGSSVGLKCKMDATLLHLQLLIFLVISYEIKVAASQSIIRSLPGFHGDLPFKLETGYVGVGEKDEIQLFYYFIESETSPQDDPLVLWLTGGPGCSAFSSLIYETGPFSIKFDKSGSNSTILELNSYSWTKFASMLYLEAPVGTGFSYATSSQAYITTDSLSAKTNYNFIRKWLIAHPKFLKNPLYIAGDSQAGIIIPILIQEIINGNEVGLEPAITNLKGYILGNPLTDERDDFNLKVEYSYRHSLISDELYESAETNCKGEYLNIDPNNVLCLDDFHAVEKCWNGINFNHILENLCKNLYLLRSVSYQLPDQPQCRENDYIYSYIWANDPATQDAMNIRKGSIKEWVRCNNSIRSGKTYTSDVKSTIHYHQNFVRKGYRVLVYSGDQDMVVPYISTQRWIKSMNLTIAQAWRPWFVDEQVAGYTVRYTNEKYQHDVTFTTLKGAGHTAPEYKPKESFAMIARWFAQNPL